MKKGTFCELKTSLSTNFDHNLQTFRGFCQVYFYVFVANFSMTIIFYLPENTDKPNFVTFLVFVSTTKACGAVFKVWGSIHLFWREVGGRGCGIVDFKMVYRVAWKFCGSFILRIGDFLWFAGTNFCGSRWLKFPMGTNFCDSLFK